LLLCLKLLFIFKYGLALLLQGLYLLKGLRRLNLFFLQGFFIFGQLGGLLNGLLLERVHLPLADLKVQLFFVQLLNLHAQLVTHLLILCVLLLFLLMELLQSLRVG